MLLGGGASALALGRPPFALAAGESPRGLPAVSRTARALGADIRMTVLHATRRSAELALDAAFGELILVDGLMSLYRPASQLSRLNRDGYLEAPHAYLVEVLEKARAVSQRTGGAFDVTVQPLWEVYAAAAREGRLPRPADVEAARANVAWWKVEISSRRIALRQSGMAITLNGIAQGYAADKAIAALRSHGVEHALVDTGELGALGDKGADGPWSVGVQHPRRADAYAAVAELAGRCMATSGDYETFFSPDHSCNHIFDPATGRSPTEFSSVTVVAPTAVDADALSTAIFVLGHEKGMALIDQTPGAEAMFIFKNGRVHHTRGFPIAKGPDCAGGGGSEGGGPLAALSRADCRFSLGIAAGIWHNTSAVKKCTD